MSNNGDYNRYNQRPGPFPPPEYYGQQGGYQQEEANAYRHGSPQLGGAAGGSYRGQHGAYGNTSSSQLSSDSQSRGGSQRTRRKGGLISGIVRGVASGIGLASESYHHHQEKKKAAAAAGEGSRAHDSDETRSRDVSGGHSEEGRHVDKGHGVYRDDDDDDDSSSDEYDGPAELEASRNMDEATWQLDDAQFEIAPPPDYAAVTDQEVDMMADRFVRNHMSPSHQQLGRRGLPMPVILPQRRPGERARGFIHAYAPLLQETGIDQTTFMDFIRDLNKATAPSPWINAINVATIAVQHVPMPVTIAVSIAAHYATKVGLEAHSRSKTNGFLDKVNADFFRPRGLIAVVLTWKPSRIGEVVSQVTFDEALRRAAQNASAGASSGFGHKMQASHATTDFEWPESAPLVFPSLDKAASTAEGRVAVEEAAKKPNAGLRGMIFAMEYMDKRAQAQWAAENPDSRLTQLGVKPEFHSRYSDPNHPASSGSLVALLTGGAIGGGQSQRQQARSGRKQARRERRIARRAEKGPTILGTIGPLALIRGVKKFINEDVLYLMIANLPSQEEMTAAQQFLNHQPQ